MIINIPLIVQAIHQFSYRLVQVKDLIRGGDQLGARFVTLLIAVCAQSP